MSEVIRGPVVGQTLGRRAHAAPNTRFPVALDEEKRTKEFRRTRRKRRMKKEEEKENRRQSNRTAEFSISRFDRFGNLQRETLKLSCENTVIFYPTVSHRSFFFFFFYKNVNAEIYASEGGNNISHTDESPIVLLYFCVLVSRNVTTFPRTPILEKEKKRSHDSRSFFSLSPVRATISFRSAN